MFNPRSFKPCNAVLAAALIVCGGTEAYAGQRGLGRVGHDHGHYRGVAVIAGHPSRGFSHLASAKAHRRNNFGRGIGYYPDATVDGLSYAQIYAALYLHALAAAETAAAPAAPAADRCAVLHERVRTTNGWQWRKHYEACGRMSPTRTGHFR